MNEIEFLEAMLSYETIGKACRAKRHSNKEKEKKSKDVALKKTSSKKQGHDSDCRGKGKYRSYSSSARKNKEYCQHCKDSDGKYWTHNILMNIS